MAVHFIEVSLYYHHCGVVEGGGDAMKYAWTHRNYFYCFYCCRAAHRTSTSTWTLPRRSTGTAPSSLVSGKSPLPADLSGTAWAGHFTTARLAAACPPPWLPTLRNHPTLQPPPNSITWSVPRHCRCLLRQRPRRATAAASIPPTRRRCRPRQWKTKANIAEFCDKCRFFVCCVFDFFFFLSRPIWL